MCGQKAYSTLFEAISGEWNVAADNGRCSQHPEEVGQHDNMPQASRFSFFFAFGLYFIQIDLSISPCPTSPVLKLQVKPHSFPLLVQTKGIFNGMPGAHLIKQLIFLSLLGLPHNV